MPYSGRSSLGTMSVAKLAHSFHNMNNIGDLSVKVFRAQGLVSADIGGKSDPFCVLELVNTKFQTPIEYKTLKPTWDKIYTFNVKDIHSVLEVTVYDDDGGKNVDFLGKVAIPLLKIRNGNKKWYALKDNKLRLRAKGKSPMILLECSINWDVIRAAVRTFKPREEKNVQPEPKLKVQRFIKNVDRLTAMSTDALEFGLFIKSCWTWDYPLISMGVFVLFMLSTYYIELYMIPIALLFIFIKNYLVFSLKDGDQVANCLEDEEVMDDEDKGDKQKSSFTEKLHTLPDVTLKVQDIIGFLASVLERCKNTFNFTVPFLSYLMIVILMVGTLVLYFIPVRYLVLLWGIKKFGKGLLKKLHGRPYISNTAALEFLRRVPDDEEIRNYRELCLDPVDGNTTHTSDELKDSKMPVKETVHKTLERQLACNKTVPSPTLYLAQNEKKFTPNLISKKIKGFMSCK